MLFSIGHTLFASKPSEAALLHPAEKDSLGFSLIDRAIFDGRLADTACLLGQKQMPTKAKLVPQESKELLSLLESDQFIELKKALSELPIDQIKEGIKNPNFAQFVQFLDRFSKTTFQPFDQHLIHLLALFADHYLVIQALKLHPEWVELVDQQGNNVTHYAALNEDEYVISTVVEKGSSLFQENSQGQTPLALLVHRVQKNDPLNWDKRDIFLFLNSWLPTTLQMAVKSGILPLYLEAIASTIATVMQHSSLNYLISFYPYLSILLSPCETLFQKFLLAVALVGTSWIPIVNLPIQAYITYSFIQRAYYTLGQAQLHFKYRPLKAVCSSLLQVSNASDRVLSFGKHLSALRLINESSQKPTSQEPTPPVKNETSISTKLKTEIDQSAQQANPSSQEFVFIKPNESVPLKPTLFVRVQHAASDRMQNMYRQAVQAAREIQTITNQALQVVDPYLPKPKDLVPHTSDACSEHSLPEYYNWFPIEARINLARHPECEEDAKVILQDIDIDVLIKELNPNQIGYSDLIKRIEIAANTLFKAREKKLQANLSVCESYELPLFFNWWNKWQDQIEKAEYPQCTKVANYFRLLDRKESFNFLNPKNHPNQTAKYEWLTKKLEVAFATIDRDNEFTLNQ